jgi:acyl-CoA hydrolase
MHAEKMNGAGGSGEFFRPGMTAASRLILCMETGYVVLL